jgi:hypothetical protein
MHLQDLRQAQSQLATLQQSIQRSLPQQQELEAAIHSLDKQHLEAVAAKQELAAELAASKQSLQVRLKPSQLCALAHSGWCLGSAAKLGDGCLLYAGGPGVCC